ncbi:hypothetical protein [Pseudomonas putida]|uniref:hypothetical protein n=1 Tax=Pseudomonas putida TaxID=303 RepID=UPI0024E07F90|nr:hypothetical protein [Pseudomonas putida]HDS0983334.1 hypothetical protein [Pseudomonas putida]
MLVLIASAIIPNIMVSPIISTMPYTVGLAHVVIRFVIRLMVGFVISFVVGTIISTIAPAAIMAWAAMATAIAAVPAATTAVATTRATAAASTTSAMTTATTATTSSAAMATATAASTTTMATTTTTTATILRIRAGGTANGVRHQNSRSRQHSTDSQSQQAFPEHDEPPLGVAQGCMTHPVISGPPMGRPANQRDLPSAAVERDPSGPAGQIFQNVS